MGFWAKLGEKIGIKLFSRGAEKTAAKSAEKAFLKEFKPWEYAEKYGAKAGEAIGNGAKTAGKFLGESGGKIITKSRVVYAALIAGGAWLLFGGGLPKLFSQATGLPLWASQLIIAALIVFLALSFISALIKRVKRVSKPFGGNSGYKRY